MYRGRPIHDRSQSLGIRLLIASEQCLCVAPSASSRDVSEMLGHASITLTMDTYSHVTPDMQRESANRLDELLSSA